MTSPADLFEPNQVSSAVSADASPGFFEEHGFFYQENAEIGLLVNKLYDSGRARSDDAALNYFRPAIQQDTRLCKILDRYPNEVRAFRFPWGTTPGYYKWTKLSGSKADNTVVVYLVGTYPPPTWGCCDGSHHLESDGEVVENGTYQLDEALLKDYPTRDIKMVQGGVLLVHTRFAHRAIQGRSLMLGLQKPSGTAPAVS